MISVFLLSFGFSFLGSIPPGAINISVIQLSLEGKKRAALRFSLASALVEIPYVIIAVLFSEWLLSADVILENMTIISTTVIFILAIINSIHYFKKENPKPTIKSGGFRKGLLISIFNPLAIPFWVGITSFLIDQNWLAINENQDLILYCLGVATGTFSLLLTLLFLSDRVNLKIKNQKLTKLIPAVVFYILGFYGLYKLLI